MNIYAHFESEIRSIIDRLVQADQLPSGLDTSRITCEAPRDPSHGDLATNAAMVLAKAAGVKPRDLAEQIAEHLQQVDGVDSVDIAGPGFINMRLDPSCWRDRINDILAAGGDWGKSSKGKGQTVNVEYVSANPTGPLHAAHARGAIIGDAMASLLETAGYTVTREYYINDAGTQVDTLARSAYLRYREAMGEDIGEIPKGFYPGDYLKETGQKLADEFGDRFMTAEESEWLDPIRSFAIDDMMAGIKHDLTRLGITMDVFSSERALVANGVVDQTMDNLAAKGLIYEGVLEPPKGKTPEDWEPREQTLFKATEYGDDIDRPIKKSDGTWTYFASDVAYHLDKLSRGSARLIDIWGADHGGYVKRMQAAVAALSGEKNALDVRLCQLVNLMDQGKPVKMSKRAGTFVTLSDVLDSVGKDILRFIMLTRRNDQSMDFDYAKVTEQSRENPVFYVQYAHARAKSVLRQAPKMSEENADLSLLSDEAELALIKIMASYPRVVEAAADAHEPHRIAFYLNDLAAAFHSLWNKGRDHPELKFIIEGQEAVTLARLKMVEATALVIRSGLAMLGVSAAEDM
ncbi:MAG: arginine--tRNA ligase [Alphaproteobacteria bacterium]|nr:arginine--tRNA ligase [Alphaproteobacteria bacterium]